MKTEENRFKKFIKLFKKYSDISENAENIIIYGWNWLWGGTYLEWILVHFYNVRISYIIDDREISYGKKIYRHNLLEYLDKNNTIILATVSEAEICINKYGYEKNKNFFWVNEDLGVKSIGYFEWEENCKKLDIISRKTSIDIKNICGDASDYAVSRGIGLPLVCEYMKKKYPEAKILDIGCGKGGAIILFKEYGFVKVDGLEYLDELCIVARNNIKKMNYEQDCNIFQGDATVFEGLDNYTLFYMYDPFQGETFRTVINNIEKSFFLNPRKTIIVYANPYEHKKVIENGVFKLVDVVDGDWFTRMCNVYESIT